MHLDQRHGENETDGGKEKFKKQQQQQQNRLSKRWIASHFLSGKIPEEFVELSMISVFSSSSPNSPLFGFLRWLRLIATFDWDSEPLVVSINGADSVSESVISSVREGMQKKAAVPTVISEQDSTSFWTRTISPPIWRRFIAIAKYLRRKKRVFFFFFFFLKRFFLRFCSVASVDGVDPLSLFVHNFSEYDLMVLLNPIHIPSEKVLKNVEWTIK